MIKYTPAETTEWVAGNLRQAQHVSTVEILSEQVLRVARDNYKPFVAGVVSATCVNVETIKPLVKSKFGIEIIANVPSASYWTGDAINLAHQKKIATGAYGDLLRVIKLENVRSFQPKETEFIERGLRQHDRIATFDRIHDRLYRITRHDLPDLMVVMLNEYELTADHLRAARDRYGKFGVVVITNPNGSATNLADEVAATMRVEILKWGPFLGRLNRK